MLNVERALQINMAVLVILGASLLGIGNGRLWLPALALVSSIGSLYLTDIYQVLRLNRFVANLASILAAVYSLSDFFRSDSESQLLAIAGFLVFLQVLLQFQKKTSRIYWQLLVLSLLQVVVSAALYIHFESTFLFAVYALTLMTAMTLNFTFRENRQVVERRESAEKELRQRAPGRLLETWQAKPVLLFDSEHRDRATTGLLMRRSVWAGLAAVVVSVAVFYCVPKPDRSWKGLNEEMAGRTGFSTEIRFNKSGLIAQSDKVVFRASFEDIRSGKRYKLQQDPYFRGLALHRYGRSRGVLSWQVDAPMDTSYSVGELPSHPRRGSMDIVKFDMEPTNEEILFSVHPNYRLADTPETISLEPFTATTYREPLRGPAATQSFTYTVAAGAVQDRIQSKFHPYFDVETRSFEELMDPGTRALLTQRRYDEQTYLRQKAEELVADLPRTDHRRIAELLESHFQLSPDYRYTLDFSSISMNKDLDPIEDFVKNHRAGHCEYFASALCLTLRYMNIPSRVVVGYRGGTVNQVTHVYSVKEKHAHAWVECYLRPDQLTEQELEQGLGSSGGVWMRLDPTPPSAFEESDDLFAAAGDAADLAQVLWDDFVFGLDRRRQKSYYQRVLGESYLEQLFNLNKINQRLRDTSKSLGIDRGPGRIVAQLVFVAVLATLAGGWWLWRRRRQNAGGPKHRVRGLVGSMATLISPKLGLWIAGEDRDPLQGDPVEFYEQLTRLLKRAGWQRSDSQTAAEFIHDVQQDLQTRSSGDELATHLEDLVTAFYRVRFGNRSLTETQRQTVQQQLRRAEELLKTPAPQPTGTAAT